MKVKDTDTYILSSGEVVDANCLIIGINNQTNAIYGGYDDKIWQACYRDTEGYSTEDLCEIADYVIGKWQEFKRKIREKKENE